MKKYAIVTGSSQGLGLSLVNYLLDENYIVFAASRSGTPIQHGNLVDIICDIRRESDVESMFEEIDQMTNEVHLVINNAGICRIDPIDETSTVDFQDHLQTNVTGVFHILKHLKPYLVDRETHILNISSKAGINGIANWTAYCASKFALEGLISACREEWKAMQIKFTNLRPGAINTGMWERLGIDVSDNEVMDVNEFLKVLDIVIKSERVLSFNDLSFSHHANSTF